MVKLWNQRNLATIRMYFSFFCSPAENQPGEWQVQQMAHTHVHGIAYMHTIKMRNAPDHLPNLLFRVFSISASIWCGHWNHRIFFSLGDFKSDLFASGAVLGKFTIESACRQLSFTHSFVFILWCINRHKKCSTRCWCICKMILPIYRIPVKM